MTSIDERTKRYAEALDGSFVVRNGEEFSAPGEWCDEARAVMAVADAELAELRAQVWAEAAATVDHCANMWHHDGNHPGEAKVCRNLAEAFRAYADGVATPSIQTLMEKRHALEDEVQLLETALRERTQERDQWMRMTQDESALVASRTRRAEAAEANVARVEALVEVEERRTAERNAALRGEINDEKAGRPFQVVGILSTRRIRAALDGGA